MRHIIGTIIETFVKRIFYSSVKSQLTTLWFLEYVFLDLSLGLGIGDFNSSLSLRQEDTKSAYCLNFTGFLPSLQSVSWWRRYYSIIHTDYFTTNV